MRLAPTQLSQLPLRQASPTFPLLSATLPISSNLTKLSKGLELLSIAQFSPKRLCGRPHNGQHVRRRGQRAQRAGHA